MSALDVPVPSWRRRLRALPLHLFPTTLLLWTIHVTTLFALHNNRILHVTWDATGVLLGALSFLSLGALAQAVHLGLAGWPRLALGAQALLVFSYAVLCLYHFDAQVSLEWDLLRTNYREIFFAQSLKMIVSQAAGYLVAIVALAALTVAVLRWRRLLPSAAPPRPAVSLAVAVGLYAAVFFHPSYSLDELTFLLQTLARPSLGPPAGAEPGCCVVGTVDPRSPHPLWNLAPPPAAAPARPHVVLLISESLNANVVGARTPEGRPVTPVLDALLPTGLRAPRFYGNSVQTAHGQVAVLCSLLPLLQGKAMTDFPRTRVSCLPEVLRGAGYRTLYFTAGQDEAFDNTGDYMRAHGFDAVRSMTNGRLTPEEKAHVWGWGLQDDWFYRRVLRELDAQHAAHPDAPLFVTLANASNHMRFTDLPEAERTLIPHPTERAQDYLNSLNFTDRAYTALVEGVRKRGYLADTILIIVGDHSFPNGEHGVFHNEVAAYEESFRTLFWLRWPGHVAPALLPDAAYSQLDVAPTVVHLLGLTTPTSFLGRSLLLPVPPAARVAPLVQPYDGKYVAAVHGQYKYTKHLRMGREMLFNLVDDPGEQQDLSGRADLQQELALLRREASVVYLGQQLVEQDRMTPPAAAVPAP